MQAVGLLSSSGVFGDRLARRIGLRLLLLALAITAAAGFLSYDMAIRNEIGRVLRAHDSFLDAVAPPIATAIWRVDTELVGQFAGTLAAMPGVAGVAITESDKDNGARLLVAAGSTTVANGFTIGRDLVTDNARTAVGRVSLVFNSDMIRSRARDEIVTSLVVTGFVIFGITIGALLLVYNSLSLPLRRIAGALTAANHETQLPTREGLAPIRAAALRDDSIGTVAATLVGLFARLADSVAALQTLNQNLEVQVADRTKRLAVSEQTLSDALNSMDAGVLIYDARRRLVDWNSQYTQMHPLAADAIRSGAIADAILDRLRAHGYVDADAGKRRALTPGKYIHPTQDGRSIQTSIREITGGGHVVVATDLTELHQAFTQAEISNAIMRESLDAFKLSYTVWGQDGTLLAFSSTGNSANLFADPQVRLGMSFDETMGLLRRHDMVEAREGSTVVDGRTWLGDLPLERRVGVWDRNLRNGRFLRTRVTQREGGGYVVVTLDLTEIHQARALAQRNEQVMREAVSAIGAIFSVWNADGTMLINGSTDSDNRNAVSDAEMPAGAAFPLLQSHVRKNRGGGEIPDKSTVRDGRTFSEQPDIGSAAGTWDRRFPDGGYVRSTVKRLPNGEYLLVTIDLTALDKARQAAETAEETLREIVFQMGASFGTFSPDEHLLVHGDTFSQDDPRNLVPGGKSDIRGVSYRDVLELRKATGFSEEPARSTKRDGKTYLHYTPLADRLGVWDRYLTDGRYLRTTVTRLRDGNYAVFSQNLTEIETARTALAKNERMAALGALVAGVAHEVNTPLGVSVTASSLFLDTVDALNRKFKARTLAASDFEKFVATSNEIATMLMRNLKRAAELIANFKQVSVDQTSDLRRTFELRSYIDEVVQSLRPALRKTQHRIEVHGDAVEIDSFPGAVAQIVTNLAMNAVAHAFPDPKTAGLIRFDVSPGGGGMVRLSYKDDGQGIDEETLRKIFDPFFTTKRGQGGTGLGMTIVHNLVVDRLGGTIKVESAPGAGFEATIEIPATAPERATLH